MEQPLYFSEQDFRFPKKPVPLSDDQKQAYKARIKALLAAKDAVLVAHYYTDPEIQALEAEIYPMLSTERDAVTFNPKMFARVKAVYDQKDRLGLDEARSLATMLRQAEEMGTSLGETLTVFSDDMRSKRMLRAEEKANMLPTKLTLGTMLFTVPPLLVILIGPSVYGMVTMLTQLAGGL